MVKKKKKFIFAAAILIIAIIAAIAGSCEKILNSHKIDSYYLTGSNENRERLIDLFSLLAEDEISAENTFAIVREIANNLTRAREYGKLINFLSERTINYPDDPYNSYYLLMIAFAYMQQDSPEVAALYFDIIIKNYPDLSVNNESIHLACLKQLIELNDNPVQQVWYYQELISRFSESIDLGVTWFMLAQANERIGNWKAAIQAYTSYLPYIGTIVPGYPNADNYARQQVFFSNSPKNWTYESLSALLIPIKAALDTGNPYQLMHVQAKVNFFARSWGQGETDDSGMADFHLSDFMRGNRIRYADSLDSSSHETEAFLRTWGWAENISIWYLYFRKIYFPSDPEIHGRWEWAGIYYGEKF